MIDKNKARTRRLIELGGIVSIAELDQMDKGQLLGLLVEAKLVFDRLPKEKKQRLFKKGWGILKERKEKRRVANKAIKNEVA